MAYKKYIKRGGKIYGPYVYHSKRVDGKVVSEYIGPQKKLSYKKISLVILGIFVLLMLVFFLRNFNGETTGKAVLDFDVDHLDLEAGLIEGSLNLSLQEEDFIPAISKLIFENGGNISEFYLADLVSESEIAEKTIHPAVYFNLIIEFKEQVSEVNETNKTESNLTVNETNVTGGGGEEIGEVETNNSEETESNVTVNETVSDNESEEATGEGGERVNETVEENENEGTESNNEVNEDTETGEDSESEVAGTIENNEEENIQETTEETEGEVTEEENEAGEENEPVEESNEAPLTGETIKTSPENENQILISKIAKIISGFFLSLRTTGYATESPMVVFGDVSFNQDFLYDLEKGQVVESLTVEKGSVRTDSKNLSEDDIEIKTEDSKVIVTTNYSESVEGFFEADLIINMSNLNITFVPGELKVKIVEPDSGEEIFSFLIMISKEGIEGLTENETEILFLPEIIELDESERNILIKEFGENVSVNVSEAMEKNNLLVVKYELADYEMIRSYDLKLSEEVIKSFMERDRIKLLKDIAMTLSREEEPGKTREEFLGEWRV